MALLLLALLALSTALMHNIRVGHDPWGLSIAEHWCTETGRGAQGAQCLEELNSSFVRQGLALALFLFIIALTVINMEWRVGAAVLALALLLLLGVVPPQHLVGAVAWDLILFLIGSMTLAGVLRGLGVFQLLAVKVLELSRGSALLLTLMLSLLSFFLSAVLDEATSIVYVTMLVLEVGRVANVNVAPLLILAVLATNTGSSALPIGNPIGVYLLFEAKLGVSSFIRYALPAALINLFVLLASVATVERGALGELEERLRASAERIEAYILSRRLEMASGGGARANGRARRALGLALLATFVAAVALSEAAASALSRLLGTPIDPQAFLAFIPYIFVAVALVVATPMQELSSIVGKFVEWPSLLFFAFLFMFSYALRYTGAMAKLAYAIALIGAAASPRALIPLLELFSALLSSLLDNLSVVVTFTPIVATLCSVGLVGSLAYFALLFGGVFGGNYTPVGSTANIIAVALAEKRKVKVTWGAWLRMALLVTTLQLLAAVAWLEVNSILMAGPG